MAGKQDDSVVTALGDLNLSKQEEGDNQQKAAGQATAEDSGSSDSDSSDGDNKNPVTSTNGVNAEAAAPQAPVELKGEVSYIPGLFSSSTKW